MKCTNGYTGQTENYTYRYPEMKSRLYKAAMNDHLTKIITQKFIANTPWLPLETWSDHRRLGLPFFENACGREGAGQYAPAHRLYLLYGVGRLLSSASAPAEQHRQRQ